MFMESGYLVTKGLIYNGYLAYMLFSYIYKWLFSKIYFLKI